MSWSRLKVKCEKIKAICETFSAYFLTKVGFYVVHL